MLGNWLHLCIAHLSLWRSGIPNTRDNGYDNCPLLLDAAYAIVAALGHVGAVQFRDMCPDRSPAQRLYSSQVRSSRDFTALPCHRHAFMA